MSTAAAVSTLADRSSPIAATAPRCNGVPVALLLCEVFGITVRFRDDRSFRASPGLRRLLEDDTPRFLPSALACRIRRILTVLLLAEDIDDFIASAPSGWRVHRLTGDRRGEWSVSVSGNWRITFEEVGSSVERLHLEDYH